MTKLKYNQKHLKNLFNQGKIGIVFAIIILIIDRFIEYSLWSMSSYIFLMIVYYFTAYFYKKKKQYITVNGDVIKKNIMFGGSVNLNEVIDIKKYHDEYYLVTPDKKFYVNTALMDEKSKQIMLEIIDGIINQAV